MKFNVRNLYDGYTRFSKKGYDPKFKMAAIPIYGKHHSNDFFSRTTEPIWLIFCIWDTSLYQIAKIVSVESKMDLKVGGGGRVVRWFWVKF